MLKLTGKDAARLLGELESLVSTLEDLEVFEAGTSEAYEDARATLTAYGVKGYDPHPITED